MSEGSDKRRLRSTSVSSLSELIDNEKNLGEEQLFTPTNKLVKTPPPISAKAADNKGKKKKEAGDKKARKKTDKEEELIKIDTQSQELPDKAKTEEKTNTEEIVEIVQTNIPVAVGTETELDGKKVPEAKLEDTVFEEINEEVNKKLIIPLVKIPVEVHNYDLKNSQQEEEEEENIYDSVAEDIIERGDNTIIEITKKETGKMDLAQKIKINDFVRGISSFTGKKDENLEESVHVFVDECQNGVEMFDEVKDKEYFMSLIKTRFRGDAMKLVSGKNFKTIEELQDFMSNYYIPRKDPADLAREINMICQRPDETMDRFVERLHGLLEMTYDLFDQTHKDPEIAKYYKKDMEKQAIRAFKFGIRNHTIQTALFLETCETFQKIVEAAQKWEKIENTRHNPLQYSNRTGDGNSSKQDIILEKILQNLAIKDNKQHSSVPIQHIENKKIEDKYCDFCHRRNHTIAECRTRQNAPFCNYCHKYYHNTENCPAKTGRNNGNYRPKNYYNNRSNYQYNQRNYNNPRQNNQSNSFYQNNYNRTPPNTQGNFQNNRQVDIQQNLNRQGGNQGNSRQETPHNNYNQPYRPRQSYQYAPGGTQGQVQRGPNNSNFGVRVVQQNEEFSSRNNNIQRDNMTYAQNFDECGNANVNNINEQNTLNDSRAVCRQQTGNPK